jgi:heme iron utilization protein
MEKADGIARVKQLLSTQNLGVLATSGEEYPYTSLVGFAATRDLGGLMFATLKQTRKYANLKKHPRITMLINSGTNDAGDFKDASSVTVLGRAGDTEGEERESLQSLYLFKFPFLEDFIKDPACALVKMEIEKFILVTSFQEVTEIEHCKQKNIEERQEKIT